eukprot:m.35287 g.35287  ORF g.35287 m.35287 type:complete len:929 (+) comp17112_c0_seq1:165-2951(+)
MDSASVSETITWLTRGRRRWKVVSFVLISMYLISNMALISKSGGSLDHVHEHVRSPGKLLAQHQRAQFVDDGLHDEGLHAVPVEEEATKEATQAPRPQHDEPDVGIQDLDERLSHLESEGEEVNELDERVVHLEDLINNLSVKLEHTVEENNRIQHEQAIEISEAKKEAAEALQLLEEAKAKQLEEPKTTAKAATPTSRPTPSPTPIKPVVTEPTKPQETPKAAEVEATTAVVPAESKTPWNGTRPQHEKVRLDLTLPDKYLHRPEYADKDATFARFGFDLRTSNNISLYRDMDDMRTPGCKAITYPDFASMPTVSVIVIYYNEAMSTLLRLIVSVINNSPKELLKEIVLINDNSTLDELDELPAHLDKLRASDQHVPPIRSIYRSEHTGIVGARIVGAKEATQDIIIFLDSHCETTPGWLEPMVARIHADRTRVIVPIVRGFKLDTLQMFNNVPWPPSKGVFNWRVNYKPVMADAELDLLEPEHPYESPVRNPVMPGGLFAMDRKFFFEIGEYDPHLMYYGAEHVEMSLRIWMCGGSMEVIPCSNVGHIFREFNRFDEKADPLINKKDHKINVGNILNRNDARVGAVWMDNYNSVFFRQRALEGIDLGEEIQDRRDLRTNLKCHNFQWFLDNVNVPQFYIPDINATVLSMRTPDQKKCLDAGESFRSVPTMVDCTADTISTYDRMRGMTGQLWSYTSKKRIQTAFYIHNKEFQCLRANRLALTSCNDGAIMWSFDKRADGFVRPRTIQRGEDLCLERRVDLGDTSVTTLAKCSETNRQLWRMEDVAGATGSVHVFGSTPGWGGSDACLDNMQRTRGGFGYYNCHRGATQQWKLTADGKIQSTYADDICVGIAPVVEQFMCIANDVEQDWIRDNKVFHPAWDKSLCLGRTELNVLNLTSCNGNPAQEWEMPEKVLEYGVGVTGGLRYN